MLGPHSQFRDALQQAAYRVCRSACRAHTLDPRGPSGRCKPRTGSLTLQSVRSFRSDLTLTQEPTQPCTRDSLPEQLPQDRKHAVGGLERSPARLGSTTPADSSRSSTRSALRTAVVPIFLGRGAISGQYCGWGGHFQLECSTVTRQRTAKAGPQPHDHFIPCLSSQTCCALSRSVAARPP